MCKARLFRTGLFPLLTKNTSGLCSLEYISNKRDIYLSSSSFPKAVPNFCQVGLAALPPPVEGVAGEPVPAEPPPVAWSWVGLERWLPAALSFSELLLSGILWGRKGKSFIKLLC